MSLLQKGVYNTMTKCNYQLTEWLKSEPDLQFAIDTLKKYDGVWEVKEQVKKVRNYHTNVTVPKVEFAVFIPITDNLRHSLKISLLNRETRRRRNEKGEI